MKLTFFADEMKIYLEKPTDFKLSELELLKSLATVLMATK